MATWTSRATPWVTSKRQRPEDGESRRQTDFGIACGPNCITCSDIGEKHRETGAFQRPSLYCIARANSVKGVEG
jgi:hypothetical protein